MKEIEQGTWGYFEKEGYPGDVEALGLGPCTGVIVFDPRSGDAYGAHLTSPDVHERVTLDEMLSAAQRAFSGSPNINIWVSGCCEIRGLAGHAPFAIRQAVEAAVRSAFPSTQPDFRWPPSGVNSVSMALDQHSGECHIEFSNYPCLDGAP
jgi:hypothetical protein